MKKTPSTETFDMPLARAKEVIRAESASTVERYVAVTVLAEHPQSTFEDLLESLRHGGSVAVRGTGGLYQRTGRRKKRGQWIKDVQNWRRYLESKGLISGASKGDNTSSG